MSDLLLFGGTTEARELAELCVQHGIGIQVCVTTSLGASLLPEVQVHVGAMDAAAMTALLRTAQFRAVVDATHPYAQEATRNIRSACRQTGTPYLRLLRESSDIVGETVPDMPALLDRLNACPDVVLCTLGRKALPLLTQVHDYPERLWVRLLPAEDAAAFCRSLGFLHYITEAPPFSVADTLRHIHLSGAKLLVTKESGAPGGYPEKAEAVRRSGIRMLTLLRPPEEGLTCGALMQRLEEGTL